MDNKVFSFPQTIAPPRARIETQSRSVHKTLLEDSFAWLRDDNWQEVMRNPEALDSEIRAYLEAENNYTDAMLLPVRTLREALVSEMRARIKEEDESVPARNGPYHYYTRFKAGQQHPLVCRRDSNATEEILLDAQARADGEDFFHLGHWQHSPDHALFAYGGDYRGSEFYRISVCKAGTDNLVDDAVTDSTGDFVWTADAQSFFYVWRNAELRPARVYRHRIGTEHGSDELIYEETDPGFYLGLGHTQSGRYLIIEPHDNETSEIRLLDLHEKGAKPVLLRPREKGIRYDVEHIGDRLFILTNEAKAEDFKILEVSAANFLKSSWTTFEPHKPGRLILHMLALKQYLIWLERENSLPRIHIKNLGTQTSQLLAFDEETYDLDILPGYEHDTDVLRFAYSSMATPRRIYDYDLVRNERVLRKEQEIPSGHDANRYTTRLLRAKARDGALIPISLFYAKDTPLDGSAPLLLYGYGAYGISIPAAFNSNRLSLVDRGFIYAIAHIRGGKECGYRWYTDGKRFSKKNTFNDYIDCARFLIEQGFTREGRIVAHGGSAGGMLMGAVANAAPELFAAILAEVPFVDVLNTMLDESLPLTPPEWVEWGNPITDVKAFQYIRSYSPYDNIKAQTYPAILAMTGLTDPRVTYWEPAKWVAKLRAHAKGRGPFLLHTNMAAGHAGASGRFERLEEVSLVYAFALMATGKSQIERQM